MDEKNRYTKDLHTNKEKRRRLLLIPLHALVLFGIAFLVVALIQAQQKVEQITMIPTPGVVESLPTANTTATPSPTPAASAGTATPTTVVTPTTTTTTTATPTPTAPPTVTPTPRPSGTPRPTTTASPSTSTSPSATTPPTQTAEPTPEFTYSVSAKQGVAPAGFMIVSVVVNPAGDYTVTYDGEVMDFNGSKYYLTVQALEDGSYRSHVKVRKN